MWSDLIFLNIPNGWRQHDVIENICDMILIIGVQFTQVMRKRSTPIIEMQMSYDIVFLNQDKFHDRIKFANLVKMEQGAISLMIKHQKFTLNEKVFLVEIQFLIIIILSILHNCHDRTVFCDMCKILKQ